MEGKVIKDWRQPNLTEATRNFVRQHQLYHEAYLVARQINRAENVQTNSNGENNERY